MANIVFNVPSKVYATLTYEYYMDVRKGMENLAPYKDTIQKVGELTNLTSSLITCIATIPTYGVNITPSIKTIKDPKKQTSKTALIGGICYLDYAVAKKALLKEIQEGRLSQAEENYLSDDPQMKSLIQTLRTTKSATVTTAELSAPLFNLGNIKTSLMLGAILLGQKIDATQNGEGGLFSYYEANDSATADRNTRLCVGGYGIIDILENQKRYSFDVEAQIRGMKAIWLNADNKYILGVNAKGQLYNPLTNYVYNPQLAEGVKKGIVNGFKILDLAVTDVQDSGLQNKYLSDINALKQQARTLKLIS